jgi:hypothetical protein
MNLDWRYRLKGDPANWLLDSVDNPSVAFWFLRDIVHRPEQAAALVQLREAILFSQPVQEILAAQHRLGYWHNPELLDEPRHTSTLWTLAHLAELGIPRTSRRARAACEYALENLNLADKSILGLLAHSLLYFNYRGDARLSDILREVALDARRGNIFALWGLAAAADEKYSDSLNKGTEEVMNRLARGEFTTFGAFPSFDPDDALLALRLLAYLDRSGDERAAGAIEQVWARQGEGARWLLEKSYNGSVATGARIASDASKWATLNALRILTKT